MAGELRVEFTVQRFIRRPPADVFAAVADPAQLCRYFTATAAPALAAGVSARWTWAGGDAADVHVTACEPPARIEFHWEAYRVSHETQVRMTFAAESGGTRVAVHETGWQPDDAGLQSSYAHCAGWQEMLDHLRAWLEHGIDLRV